MEPPSRLNVAIIEDSEFLMDSDLIQRATFAALIFSQIGQGDVCVKLTDSATVRQLNRDFRGIDEETDVLTFPAEDPTGEVIGDIAISVPYAIRQAALRHVSANEEVGFLAIHGALHLAGYDDQTERDRAAMVGRMNEVALQVGLTPDLEWHSRLHEVAA